MNEKLLKQLFDERSKLYPNGCPIQPRGWEKTYIYLVNLIRWVSYDYMAEICRGSDVEYTLDDIHNKMEKYINDMLGNFWDCIESEI